MNSKEREDIIELKTHVKYIRKSIDKCTELIEDVSKQMDRVEKISNENRINFTNHLSQHKRDIALLTIGLSVMVFIINYVVR